MAGLRSTTKAVSPNVKDEREARRCSGKGRGRDQAEQPACTTRFTSTLADVELHAETEEEGVIKSEAGGR